MAQRRSYDSITKDVESDMLHDENFVSNDLSTPRSLKIPPKKERLSDSPFVANQRRIMADANIEQTFLEESCVLPVQSIGDSLSRLMRIPEVDECSNIDISILNFVLSPTKKQEDVNILNVQGSEKSNFDDFAIADLSVSFGNFVQSPAKKQDDVNISNVQGSEKLNFDDSLIVDLSTAKDSLHYNKSMLSYLGHELEVAKDDSCNCEKYAAWVVQFEKASQEVAQVLLQTPKIDEARLLELEEEKADIQQLYEMEKKKVENMQKDVGDYEYMYQEEKKKAKRLQQELDKQPLNEKDELLHDLTEKLSIKDQDFQKAQEMLLQSEETLNCAQKTIVDLKVKVSENGDLLKKVEEMNEQLTLLKLQQELDKQSHDEKDELLHDLTEKLSIKDQDFLNVQQKLLQSEETLNIAQKTIIDLEVKVSENGDLLKKVEDMNEQLTSLKHQQELDKKSCNEKDELLHDLTEKLSIKDQDFLNVQQKLLQSEETLNIAQKTIIDLEVKVSENGDLLKKMEEMNEQLTSLQHQQELDKKSCNEKDELLHDLTEKLSIKDQDFQSVQQKLLQSEETLNVAQKTIVDLKVKVSENGDLLKKVEDMNEQLTLLKLQQELDKQSHNEKDELLHDLTEKLSIKDQDFQSVQQKLLQSEETLNIAQETIIDLEVKVSENDDLHKKVEEVNEQLTLLKLQQELDKQSHNEKDELLHDLTEKLSIKDQDFQSIQQKLLQSEETLNIAQKTIIDLEVKVSENGDLLKKMEEMNEQLTSLKHHQELDKKSCNEKDELLHDLTEKLSIKDQAILDAEKIINKLKETVSENDKSLKVMEEMNKQLTSVKDQLISSMEIAKKKYEKAVDELDEQLVLASKESYVLREENAKLQKSLGMEVKAMIDLEEKDSFDNLDSSVAHGNSTLLQSKDSKKRNLFSKITSPFRK